ncbi:unnamed protein product [Euphydryas editha]|uniref:Reverse transcriptase domain-containing protein n=1 Tax=Euphydryas editha TaxID=104508 RepID=A0AAU9U8H4_EUPED|nr:unnamed protein product [Euphydryas editha]
MTRLDILQWNINGFYRRKQRLKILLTERNPSCICLQETNFKNNCCHKLSGYEAIFKNRNNSLHASGGVVSYIKSNIFVSKVSLNTNLEAVAGIINYPTNITLCNIYLPNSTVLNKEDLIDLIEQLPKPFLLVGDFNSHSLTWGCTKTDSRGKILLEILDAYADITILNENQPTYFNVSNASTSAIDLALSSCIIAPLFQWSVLDNPHDSGHYPIIITHSSPTLQDNPNVTKWIFQKANWELFKSLIDIGPDDIPNCLIKNLPDSGLIYILKLYNKIWQNNLFPDLWRTSIIIPIPKPGKDHTLPSNYRPIALTCNLCKILEKIIANRIRWKLEHEELISPYQSGFRKFRSINDHLILLDTAICEALALKGHLLAVSMDIEKAYEMVSKKVVLKALKSLNITGNSLKFVNNFLSNRKIKVRINYDYSDPIDIANGLPQGSVVSVILFLITINSLLSVINNPVKGLLFADDLTLFCMGKNIETSIQLIQKSLNEIYKWSNENGFKFSKSKTEFIIFSRQNKPFDNINLLLDGHPLTRTYTIKILGMIFDIKDPCEAGAGR